MDDDEPVGQVGMAGAVRLPPMVGNVVFQVTSTMLHPCESPI